MRYSNIDRRQAQPLTPCRSQALNGHDFDGIDSISLVAHQMLTPLAVIDGTAQRLIRSNGQTGMDVAERARRIRAAAQELVTLAHGLLDQVRASMESNTQTWVRYSLNEVLQAAADRIRSLQPERAILIDIPRSIEQVHGRPELLGQMLAILLDNAAKYSELDRPIKVNASRSSGRIVVSVSDEGIGIPSEEVEKIFQPFYRARNTASGDGIGLGLSLAQKIARCHGGDISVSSDSGRGSTFSITLPQAPTSSKLTSFRSRTD